MRWLSQRVRSGSHSTRSVHTNTRTKKGRKNQHGTLSCLHGAATPCRGMSSMPGGRKKKLLLHQQNGNDTLPCGPPADPFTGRFEALTPQEHRPQMATLHSTGTPASVSARTNACVSAVVGVRCPSSG